MSPFIFVPLPGVQLGASDFEVDVVGAECGIAFLFSSLISGWKSDHPGRLLFVRWGLLISSMAFAAQLLAHRVRVQDIFLGDKYFNCRVHSVPHIVYSSMAINHDLYQIHNRDHRETLFLPAIY